MNNLEKAIERLSELLDEMSDTMDVDANGDPDDAMCWATQLSDVLVRLKRHAKADTKTTANLCQATPPAAQSQEEQQ